MWDTSPKATLFPVKVWGFGWSFNFGYPLIKSKPLIARFFAWLLGMTLIIGITYALFAVAMLIVLLLR